jgi:diacylglycerol kinase (ATP)
VKIRNAIVIANPTSGHGACYKVLPPLEEEMKKAGWKYSIQIPQSRDDALKITRESSSKGFDAVIAVGGDGTIHDVVEEIDLEKQALGMLPLGSGNDLFRMLKIKDNHESAIRNIIDGDDWKIDVGLVNDKRFLNTAGTGIDSETLVVRRDTKGFVKRNYALLFLKTLGRLKPFMMKITADDKIIESEFMWVIVANNNYIGGGMLIAPDAKQDDGLLDLVMIRKTSKFNMARNLPGVFKGLHLKMKETSQMKVRNVVFECDEERELGVDGDVRGKTPVFITVMPRALRMISVRNGNR